MTVVNRFVAIAKGPHVGYNEKRKTAFCRLGKKVLQQIADQLGLEKGTYDISWNPGGIAVSGDIILHGEEVYVVFSQFAANAGGEFMYRCCKGRKDYTGGHNQWMGYEMLKMNFDAAVKILAHNMRLTRPVPA